MAWASYKSSCTSQYDSLSSWFSSLRQVSKSRTGSKIYSPLYMSRTLSATMRLSGVSVLRVRLEDIIDMFPVSLRVPLLVLLVKEVFFVFWESRELLIWLLNCLLLFRRLFDLYLNSLRPLEILFCTKNRIENKNMGKTKNLILVGDIPKDAQESELKELFQQYGQIKKIYFHHFPDFLSQANLNDLQELVKLMKNSSKKNKAGDVLGHYCLISFSRRESVEKCIYASVNYGT